MKKRLITFDGETLCLKEWASLLQITPSTLFSRIARDNGRLDKALTRGKNITKRGTKVGDGFLSSFGHIIVKHNGKRIRKHVLIVEEILGKKLPINAIVHHMDSNPANNEHTNLVVCPSDAYHQLLHQRIRAFNASGNANYRKCTICQKYDDPMNNMYFTRKQAHHRQCRNDQLKGERNDSER